MRFNFIILARRFTHGTVKIKKDNKPEVYCAYADIFIYSDNVILHKCCSSVARKNYQTLYI